MEKIKNRRLNISSKITSVILSFLLLFAGVGVFEADAAESGFYTSGTTIYDANGQAFVMRGINTVEAWQTSQSVETTIERIAELGCNTVRVAVGNGDTSNTEADQKWAKTSESKIQSIINTCKENDIICVLEVHNATGSNDVNCLKNAANYWIELKDLLNANKKYVIVNIANEWGGAWDSSAWASGYKEVIPMMRNAGIENMLMVDCAGWGQYPTSIWEKGSEVLSTDSHNNTVFSIHMYEYAGSDSSTVKSNIDKALGVGAPLVIGEFGCYHTGGDVDEDTIMSYCQQRGVGWLAWSWWGNGSSWSYLDISNSHDYASLTTWGNRVISGSNGVQSTSVKCSVFGSSSSVDSSSSSSSSGSSSTIAQGGSATLSWGTDYTMSFNLSGYKSAKIVVEASASQLKLAVNPGWNELVYQSDVYGTYTYEFSESEISAYSGDYTLFVQGVGSVSSVKIVGSNSSSDSSYTDSSSSADSSSSSLSSDSTSAIVQGGSATLSWGTDYTMSFNLSGYESAKIVVEASASQLKLAVNPGWNELVYQSDVYGTYTYEFSESEISAYSGDYTLFVQGVGSVSSVKIVGSNSSSDSSYTDSSSTSDSSSDSSSDSDNSSETQDSYESLFWGQSSGGAWGQAVSVLTSKNGGSYNAGNISSNGYFYVEYSGTENQLELILQSWSGGAGWAKVSVSETGQANGHYYAKYSFDNCVEAFGTSDFANKLDQIHVGAMNDTITVYSLCYCYPS